MSVNTKIVLIGAGNVATHLGKALQAAGYTVLNINSRTLQGLPTDADVYIFSVSDDALPTILSHFPAVGGLLVHTAGSVPMSVFQEAGFVRSGVLYPLQTFSKSRPIVFEHVPFFIEAATLEDEALLKSIASLLSDTVIILPSEKRRYLHLAAVFACNFTNHLYAEAAELVESQGLDWQWLLPLIQETANKVTQLPPRQAQTGPAVRYDTAVMAKQLDLLAGDERKQEMYRLLSQAIHDQAY
jgi:predicted short-subunit dehydrogenase-like oxidoreductase (DUF2520 family)